MIEHFFQCPYCWETISVLLDPAYDADYIEDCEVCCNPIQITASIHEAEVHSFDASSIEQ